MKADKYNDNEILFLRENRDDYTIKDLSELFNNKFNRDISSSRLRKDCEELGILCNKRNFRCKYTEDQIEFLRVNRVHNTCEKLTHMFNEKYKCNKSIVAIKSMLHEYNISGHIDDRRYVDEEIEFLKKYGPICQHSELEKRYEETFRKFKSGVGLRCKCKKLGIEFDHDEWKKLNPDKTVWNKGMPTEEYLSTFKFDHRTVHVGDERIAKNGAILVAIENKHCAFPVYITKSRYIYEQKYGKIPEGYVVMHLDGDLRNDDLDNLVSVPKAYQSYFLRNHWHSDNKEFTKACLKYCELVECIKR